MTCAGWFTMILCWLFVIGFSFFFIVKTLRTPLKKSGTDPEMSGDAGQAPCPLRHG